MCHLVARHLPISHTLEITEKSADMISVPCKIIVGNKISDRVYVWPAELLLFLFVKLFELKTSAA